MPDLCDRLEALEGRFHLPAQPVGFEHLLDACVGGWAVGDDEHMLSVVAGDWANCLAPLLLDREPPLNSDS